MSSTAGTSSAVNAASTVWGARSFATPLTSSTTAQARRGSSKGLGIAALSPSRPYSVAMTTMWEDLREPPSRAARWRATPRKQPSAFLLAVQVLVILLLPVLENSTAGRAVISLLSLSAVITAVFTVRSTPALTWLSVTLALPAAVFEIWSLFDERSTILVIAHCALSVFYFYTAYGLISYMFADNWVTKDELFATGAALHRARLGVRLPVRRRPVGLARLVHVVRPGRGSAPFLELLYLSVPMLTSVGLSGHHAVLPARPVLRHDRAGRRRDVRRAGGRPPGRSHHHALAAVTGPRRGT